MCSLCVCYLRLRKAKEAVTWCEKAHAAAPADDLSTLYQLVEAKTLNGECNPWCNHRNHRVITRGYQLVEVKTLSGEEHAALHIKTH